MLLAIYGIVAVLVAAVIISDEFANNKVARSFRSPLEVLAYGFGVGVLWPVVALAIIYMVIYSYFDR